MRKVYASAGWGYDKHVEEFGRTLGEELLEPTRVYAADLLRLIRTDGVDIHALSHVTGGGLAANVARVLPKGMGARIERSTWTPPAVFDVTQRVGNVPQDDIERTLNMGVGFVAVLPAEQAATAIEVCAELDLPAWRMGDIARTENLDAAEAEIISGAKGVDAGACQIVGSYA